MSTHPFPTIAPNHKYKSNLPFRPLSSVYTNIPLPTQYPTNPTKAYLTLSTTPDTPKPSYSESMSLALLVSPDTVGMIYDSIKNVSHDTYLGLSTVEQVALDFAMTKQNMFTFTKW
jgi:hypothetical protein